MSNEYKLTEAGEFTVVELLDFQQSELEKGNTIEKIWITERQASALVREIEGKHPIKKTGKRLVDYWNSPKTLVKLESVHGIEVGIE